MKLNKNFIISIVFLSLLFSFSNSSAAPTQRFNQVNLLIVDKIKKQIINQGPFLKDKIKQGSIERQLNSNVPERKKGVNFDISDFEKDLKKDTGNIRMFINASKDINSLSDKLKTYGVRIIKIRNNMAAVEAPIENLEKIFSEVESIENARLPFRFFPWDVESEGVSLTDSDNFHNLDLYGAGVRIAVIDVGFKGLAEAQQNDDLPFNAVTYDFTGNGLETEYYHGTACAEIVYDMAPQAELYLLKISSNADIFDALDYCVDNDIDIISFSLGTNGSGPGDGTGFLDEAFDEVRANGILAVAAAGNNGNITLENGITIGAHWKGLFRDTNSDGYHEFLAGNPEIDFNIFAAYPTTNDDGDPEDSEISVLLRWDDWSSPDIDYNMILFEYDPDTGNVQEIGASTYPQNGSSSQEPVEYISQDIPDEEDYLHYYAIAIVKANGARNVDMELHLGGTCKFLPYDEETGPIAASSSSISEPADAESVLTVGAIDYVNWETGPQEDYSSQGPTNAWAGSIARIKPDIMGPDGVSTFIYSEQLSNGFHGASAATPHIAGLAALILSKYPNMTPDELQDAIESNAIDMGVSGRDNIYGWGRVKAVTNLPIYNNPGGNGGSPEGSSGGGGGCFITTAAVGSFLKPHVFLLCQFRDRFLLTNGAGKYFVNFYYSVSPPIAALVTKHKSFRIITRAALIPFFILSWMSLHFGLSKTLLIFLLLFIVALKMSFFAFKKTSALLK